MLYAVLGDIHANLHALDAVLEDVECAGADRVVCVGDVVGYGAYPEECLERVREREMLIVGGNHDWAVAGKVPIRYFNADARDAVEWTRDHLDQPQLERLGEADLTITVDDFTLFHSTLFAPEEFDYLQTMFDIRLCFKHLQTRLGFCGHSHVPVMLVENEEIDCLLTPELELRPDRRAIINVGSVGQPRDFDPRASYVLYDDQEQRVYLRRVEYDLHSASESILQAGLPITNARRLILGR
ncbi:MAG: metallophosphoesterase family protein [Planctomycetota bacterium]